jgi:hypothetical protein
MYLIKVGAIGVQCRTQGEMTHIYNISDRKSKGREQWWGEAIFDKWILQKQGTRMRTGFIWLRTGSREHVNEPTFICAIFFYSFSYETSSEHKHSV